MKGNGGCVLKKLIALEIIIIISTAVIVLSLESAVQYSVTTSATKFNQNINTGSGVKYLIFDLQSGQAVNGSYVINGYNHTYCEIIDPAGDSMISSPTDYEYNKNNASFFFIADTNGQYSLYISSDDFMPHLIDYEYSISTPTIFGFNPTGLMSMVITVSAVLAVIIFVLAIILTRHKGKQSIQ
ncbi:MAG: hypothetical protein NWE92_06055 [Candidatus Bathyarchaeota archaeon]|nr:hypothetical protein [Candidatus Bathyarchaeota archaeon]